jgi:hypothetical protein
MTDTKNADIVVRGLPYRLRSGADIEEARERFGDEATRYFSNHSEIHLFKGHQLMSSYDVAALQNDHRIDQNTIKQLDARCEQLTKERDAARDEVVHLKHEVEGLRRAIGQIPPDGWEQADDKVLAAVFFESEPVESGDGWYWVSTGTDVLVMRLDHLEWSRSGTTVRIDQSRFDELGYRVISFIPRPETPSKGHEI